jgi:hypothetical protein
MQKRIEMFYSTNQSYHWKLNQSEVAICGWLANQIARIEPIRRGVTSYSFPSFCGLVDWTPCRIPHRNRSVKNLHGSSYVVTGFVHCEITIQTSPVGLLLDGRGVRIRDRKGLKWIYLMQKRIEMFYSTNQSYHWKLNQSEVKKSKKKKIK